MAKVENKPSLEAPVRGKPKVVDVPRPTPDQLDFLKRTSLRPDPYDRSIIVGGPSRVRRPTA